MSNSRRKLKPAEQARRIVEVWQERPRPQRTSEHVLTFYGWLTEHASELVPPGPGSFQKVRDLLALHVTTG
jgi:hypothetical protein